MIGCMWPFYVSVAMGRNFGNLQLCTEIMAQTLTNQQLLSLQQVGTFLHMCKCSSKVSPDTIFQWHHYCILGMLRGTWQNLTCCDDSVLEIGMVIQDIKLYKKKGKHHSQYISWSYWVSSAVYRQLGILLNWYHWYKCLNFSPTH